MRLFFQELKKNLWVRKIKFIKSQFDGEMTVFFFLATVLPERAKAFQPFLSAFSTIIIIRNYCTLYGVRSSYNLKRLLNRFSAKILGIPNSARIKRTVKGEKGVTTKIRFSYVIFADVPGRDGCSMRKKKSCSWATPHVSIPEQNSPFLSFSWDSWAFSWNSISCMSFMSVTV